MASKIILSCEDLGCYSVSQIRKNGKSIFIQSDRDFPVLASSFGWNMRGRKCKHEGTDGTVNCPDCGKTATEFINEAIRFLDDNDGKIMIDNYGYFD